MLTTRPRHLLALLVGVLAVVVLGAVPASAAVTCADLRTQPAAQSYFEGPAADASRLDGDGDGRACEANTPISDGMWTLLGILALAMAVVVGTQVPSRRRAAGTRASGVSTPAHAGNPDLAPTDLVMESPGATEELLEGAPTGSLHELSRALQRVPYHQRMPLLEEHAREHGSAPQEVLDALVVETDDLALQRWALAGYGPPTHVRMMFCACVGAARNFRLTSVHGVRTWTCASCGSPAAVGTRAVVGGDQPVEQ